MAESTNEVCDGSVGASVVQTSIELGLNSCEITFVIDFHEDGGSFSFNRYLK